MAVGIISPSHNFGKTTCARILKGQFAHPLPAPGLFLPWQDTMPAAREICAARTAILRHQINVMRVSWGLYLVMKDTPVEGDM